MWLQLTVNWHTKARSKPIHIHTLYKKFKAEEILNFAYDLKIEEFQRKGK